MQYPVYLDIYEDSSVLKGAVLEQAHHTSDGDGVLSV